MMENNPVINRIWNEWLKRDKELSLMTEQERRKLCEDYQWLFQKAKSLVDMEALYSSVHIGHNREEFQKWFYIVCRHLFSRIHLGENSYYAYSSGFKKQFKREKCTSKVFPMRVLLALGMLGYITGLKGGYRYNKGRNDNYGYTFIVDRDKLLTWDSTFVGVPEWVMTQTEAISFEEEEKDKERISWTQYPEWLGERQYQSISSIEVIKEGLKSSSEWMFNFNDYQHYYSLSEEEQEDLMKQWVSYQKMRDLSLGIVGGCKDDSENYAGRFYTIMTNLDSSIRHQYLRLDDEKIVEVDVSSAQPSFLGLILYRETGVISEWLKQALNGHFYEWIAAMTNTQEDRKIIKKWMMQYLYSCYQPSKKKDYAGPHKPTYENRKTEDPYICFQQRLNQFLKSSEPAIFQKIDWYKRNPVFREEKDLYKTYMDEDGDLKKKKVGQGKWCSMLSYYLVKMEVEYIQRCIHALHQDMKFWTIHDCICVKESDSKEVKAIMERVSREMYDGMTLGIKRENTSEE